MSNKFLYFAFGSNLHAKRIRRNNPTAVKRDIGYIKNFRLDFNTYSELWRGAAATIVETDDSVVWGVIWEIDNCDLSALDRQEGVSNQIYRPLFVDVETPDGTIHNCRVYQQCDNPKEHVKPADLPTNRRPSPLYINLIVKGAEANQLPADYVKFLKSVPHNGYEGEYGISLSLNQD
ncbi:gamma-glutamylcyclotransferase-like [Pseudomyrmex gracilis]|uniref:gamma-glutamylcyclotransferase-like n=1 Tax=Pseudomyrmex gracilis TaxID=219809 RepID=UPI000994C9BB|nr:gamma-glutamylcyclotransferase-like [Pseudomyrmex gracilis]